MSHGRSPHRTWRRLHETCRHTPERPDARHHGLDDRIRPGRSRARRRAEHHLLLGRAASALKFWTAERLRAAKDITVEHVAAGSSATAAGSGARRPPAARSPCRRSRRRRVGARESAPSVKATSPPPGRAAG
ncbi:hypothetical protein NKH77_05210 [Streptomyces sp. M19]